MSANRDHDLSGVLRHLPEELRKRIFEVSDVVELPEGTEVLHQGQYVKVIPFVISGLIKVITNYEDKELLLYYLEKDQSCVMSFAAAMHAEPLRITAYTEEDTRALLIPAQFLQALMKEFPSFNALFFDQYNMRYSDLLDTINHLIFDKLDQRLLAYLQKKVQLTGQNPLKLSHKQIASELGTAREVITRLLKKLEAEGSLSQSGQQIKII